MANSRPKGTFTGPSSDAEDVDIIVPASTPRISRRKRTWERESELKERGKKSMPRPSPDLKLVRGSKCKRCQNLDIKEFGSYAYGGISHHTFDALTTAARNGCELCGVLSSGLGGRPVGTAEMQLERSRGFLNFSYRDQDKGQSGPKSVVLEIVVTEESDSELSRVFRPIAASPRDEACISLAKAWIRDCRTSHSKCSQPAEYAVPVRLIDVSGKTPRLSKGTSNTSYAILSHCWGKSKPFTTTSQNLELHERSINFAAMPKTFRDAIELTRELNIRYLWIDSLCILQDSEIDKGHQCARMGDYYRNSVVTLSALNSRDNTEGFLNARPAVKSIQLFEKPGQTTRFVRPRLRTRANIFKEAVLSGRGWTLQERLLSTRVLHFGTTEMFWECLTCSAREGSTIEHRDQEGIRDLVTAEGEDFKRIAFSADIDMLDPDFGAFAVWYRLIRQFSLRSLTFADDRLPAVAGLAASMAKNTGCHYVAGVWREDLEGLLWHVEPAKDTMRSTRYPFLCAVDHGARVALVPTWSWASVAGPITYLPAREKRCHSDLAASIVKIDLKVDADSPYAKVEGGSITLLAVCRRVACFTNLKWATGSFKPNDVALHWLDAGDDSDLSRKGYPTAAGFDEYSMYEQTAHEPAHVPHPYQYSVRDIRISEVSYSVDVSSLPESSKCYLAVMVAERHYESRNDRKTYFLIVKEDEIRHGHWNRVGMGWSDGWDLDNCERQEVILI